jgi:hypothetical protein
MQERRPRRLPWVRVFAVMTARRLHTLAVLMLIGAGAALGSGRAAADETVRQEKIFTVDEAGRYALRLESKAGAALQIIDRMAGPSTLVGEAGKEDGRLDMLLDRGSYKAMMILPKGAAGDVALHIDAFRELNGNAQPRLVELKPVESDLADLTQRSWWIDVPSRRTVAIEAAGRYLADLRFWKDGNWLVDVTPSEAVVEREPGHPLAVRRLVAALEPGVYLLTAYGGVGETWAKESAAKPLYLRFGVPMIGEAAQRQRTMSPFGIDRFLVTRPANHFRLQLDHADVAALTVGSYDPGDPFSSSGNRAEIAKNSRDPAVELTAQPTAEFSLVTVERQPGQPYLLQNFYSAPFYGIDDPGNDWIEVIHSANSDDDADVTGVLTELTTSGERIVAASAIELAPGQAWRRRFNLLDELTLHVAVAAPGNYRVNAEGENVEAEFRFEPVGPLPEQYRIPAFERGDHAWALESGIYRLTVRPRPEKKGIATLTIKPAEFTGDIAPARRLGTVAWRSQILSGNTSYRLYTNEVPGISHGLVLRTLPIDLASELPATLAPGEQLELPIHIATQGSIIVEAADGKPITFSLDGHAATDAAQSAAPGAHRIALANASDHPLSLSARFEPDNMRPEAPLPVMSAERLKQRPSLPTLTSEKPVFLDVAQGEQRGFNIAVEAPALYRLETGGLLHTGGNLRTRMVTSLARDDANGVGRNFLIQRYLREGDYQLSFAPQGASAGHLSLAMTATPIEDHGTLTLGIPSRATLRPGLALRYDFRIDHAGLYRLRAFGMNRQFALRAEDADGWPVAQPVVDGVLEQEFEPGLYHATLLPSAAEARSLALLEEIVPAPEYAGHGPHQIALGQHISHEWLEPEKDGERVPDRWRFTVPASADVTIDLGAGMIATLLRETGGQDTEVARFIRSPGWQGSLAAGDYRLETTSVRPNNHFPYELALRSEELLIGQSREVQTPIALPIALDGNDLVEISSFGDSDVRARLYDAEGRLIAANDDRNNDWNFDIAATLPPGRYRLQVDPVGADEAATRIDLLRPEEKTEPLLGIPGSAAVADAALHTFALSTPKESGLLILAAQSADAVSLSLERSADGSLWRSIAGVSGQSSFLAIPVAGEDTAYRLRVWSTDRKSAAIKLTTRFITETPASESALTSGLSLHRIDGVEPSVWAGALRPARPGVLHIESDSDALRWTSAQGVAAQSDASALVIAGREPVWLVERGSARAPRLHGVRVDFKDETRLLLPPGEAVIAPASDNAAGPVLWLARSRFGQPGLVVGDIGGGLTGMGIAANAGVTVATKAAPLRLWNAEDRSASLQLTLRQTTFDAPASDHFGAGERSLSLAPRTARVLTLDGPGIKRLHLALAPDTVAVLRQDDTTLATLWPDGQSRSYTTELPADSILLLNAGGEEARVTLAWTEATGTSSALVVAPGQIFKRHDGTAGTLLLHAGTSSPGAATLRIAGNGARGALVAEDGSIRRGNDVALAGHALLMVEHGPGLVAAWIEDEATVVPETALALDGKAQIIRLSGPAMRFAATPQEPVLLSLRTTAPVIASISAPDGHATTEIFPEGGRISRYLPPGRTVIALQSASEGDLAGDAEFIERLIAPIDEGLGDAVRLAAGETRIYSFALAQEETIGVGLRASVDIAQCRLLDSAGKTLGSGIVQMHKLAAGTYLLAVEMPADSAPVVIRPALVGVRAPEPAPPDEVKRHYLQLVGRLPSQ